MTFEERASLAKELKASAQCNCTQSVLKAFEDKIKVDDQALMALSSGFAAGMGCMESTCGALIGAVMCSGSLTEGKGTARYAKDILKSFKEKSGDTVCKNLKGALTGVVLCQCPDCVYNAVMSIKDAGIEID